MNRINITAPLLAALLTLSAGCSMDFEPSLVEEGTILALRATQEVEPDGPIEVEALTVGVDDLSWTVCGAPWTGTQDGLECMTPSWPLEPNNAGTGATLDLDTTPIPAEYKDLLESLWVQAAGDDEAVVPAVLTVSLTQAPNNPGLVGVLLDGVAPEDWASSGEVEIEVTPVWADETASEGATTSFYTTAGAFDPWRVSEAGTTLLTLEGTETTLTLYVIARFLGEGATWTQVEVNL
jgi:hypothetical protein